ncbi:MAG: hypothetical protein R3B09_08290 [Nannocystaceae bacterium]
MVTPRSALMARVLLGALAALTLSASACYTGAEEEGKEAPPGYPGGWCLETRTCAEPSWVCNVEGFYCYDVTDPCEGMYCGWAGTCTVDPMSKLPKCICDPGYSNVNYSLYCEQAGPMPATSSASG